MANSWGFLTGLHIELLSDLGHTPTKPNRALVTRQRDIQLSNLVLDEQNVVCPFFIHSSKKKFWQIQYVEMMKTYWRRKARHTSINAVWLHSYEAPKVGRIRRDGNHLGHCQDLGVGKRFNEYKTWSHQACLASLPQGCPVSGSLVKGLQAPITPTNLDMGSGNPNSGLQFHAKNFSHWCISLVPWTNYQTSPGPLFPGYDIRKIKHVRSPTGLLKKKNK